LKAIAEDGASVRTVSIGGINASNVQRVLFQSNSKVKSLDGVAVVSAIIGSKNPKRAAEEMMSLITMPPPFAAASLHDSQKCGNPEEAIRLVPAIINAIAEKNPLSHNMTVRAEDKPFRTSHSSRIPQ